jgi:hypothetical protein
MTDAVEITIERLDGGYIVSTPKGRFVSTSPSEVAGAVRLHLPEVITAARDDARLTEMLAGITERYRGFPANDETLARMVAEARLVTGCDVSGAFVWPKPGGYMPLYQLTLTREDGDPIKVVGSVERGS